MSAMKDPLEVSFVDPKCERPAPAVAGAAASAGSAAVAFPAASTARLRGFDEDGQALIGISELPGQVVAARSTVPLSPSHLGASVVVAFEHGDPHRPIVLGVLQGPSPAADAAKTWTRRVSVDADDDHLVLSAERQITLCCGEASITLTRAGKVIIKGAYVVSRSTGHNKIKGAVVDIN